jgi:endonuclease-3
MLTRSTEAPRRSSGVKREFDIVQMLGRIRRAVKPFKKAALFELAEEGHQSVFEILVACIISIRTFDEVTVPTARRLFDAARTPQDVATMSVRRIDSLIGTCSFHEAKAYQIHEIARRAVQEFGGQIPCDFETLTSFRGVGPKCANLVLGIACGQASGIGVDIHVHRVTNRWGYVRAATPEKTMAQLHEKLPKHYWVEINALLVPFGKHICTNRLPRCSTCPVLEFCRQVGVTAHR